MQYIVEMIQKHVFCLIKIFVFYSEVLCNNNLQLMNKQPVSRGVFYVDTSKVSSYFDIWNFMAPYFS